MTLFISVVLSRRESLRAARDRKSSVRHRGGCRFAHSHWSMHIEMVSLWCATMRTLLHSKEQQIPPSRRWEKNSRNLAREMSKVCKNVTVERIRTLTVRVTLSSSILLARFDKSRWVYEALDKSLKSLKCIEYASPPFMEYNF